MKGEMSKADSDEDGVQAGGEEKWSGHAMGTGILREAQEDERCL